MKNRHWIIPSLVVIALLIAAVPGLASAGAFPKIISLPDGFRPEGIALGKGSEFFAGSLANGAIYKGDLRTGEGGILYPGASGEVSVGMSFDERSGYLFVAGGATGLAKVFDTRSGEKIAEYTLAAPGNFINDAIVTRQAAYFTNSSAAVFYKLPLSSNGRLPDAADVVMLPLSGDWMQVAGFNANGIEATPNGKSLIIVNSTTGSLYRVDPDNGEAALIDLGGETVTMGDGLLLEGSTLYVMRNRANLIAVVELAPDLASGELVGGITDPAFDVPTTLLGFGKWIYAVNARFSTTPTPTTSYDIVQVTQW